MPNLLALRSYTRQISVHRHPYYQLVLPTLGRIEISVPDYQGWVGVGECIVIAPGTEHHFNAHENAKFIVADLDWVPESVAIVNGAFMVSKPLHHFLQVIESQLSLAVNEDIEQQLLALFLSLLAQQIPAPRLDSRIRTVVAIIDQSLAEPHTLEQLAGAVHLSVSALKTLFKRELGITFGQYLIQKRIEAAQALLRHTDTPIQRIAEQVGYNDFSAFSRRFAQVTGLSPSTYRSQN